MSIYKLCTRPPADKWLSDACMGLVLVLLDLITVCDTNLCVSYAEWQKIKKKPSKATIILSKDQQILYHFYHFVIFFFLFGVPQGSILTPLPFLPYAYTTLCLKNSFNLI